MRKKRAKSRRKPSISSQSKLFPEENRLSRFLRSLDFPHDMVDVLVGEKNTPEGKIRIKWTSKLVVEYGFPASNIAINVPAGVGRDAGKRDTPVRADIVAYRDSAKTQPFLVVETKAPGKKEGLAQAESYSRNLGAEYHLWSDGKYSFAFKSSRYPNQSEPIADLPRWIGDKPIPKRVPKTHSLPPFKDEVELRQVVGACHDLILEKQGHDPAKAFDELAKLLFLKLYDEREVPRFYEFAVLVGETPKEVAKRLRELFSKSVESSKYRDVFFSKFTKTPELSLELDDFTIFKVVQLLQGYSLVNTTDNIQGADIKGTVYEHMVGNTFRGELAQFFTPREVVEFMVDVVKPTKEDKIFDPACGSGGFLIMTIRKIKEKMKTDFPNLSNSDRDANVKTFAEQNVFGTDINERMIRVSKMNMIMHGDGHAGIFHTNGLLTDPDLPDDVRSRLKDFTVVLSNPPFAGREKDPSILKQFTLGENQRGEPRSVSKEIVFVEKVLNLVKENARVGFVLPAGCFNNSSRIYSRLRALIAEKCQILALIALPYPAFAVSGATNEGDLIFLKRMNKPPSDYSIYIDWARYVGFDTTGKKIKENDLSEILQRMRSPKEPNLIKLSELEEKGRWDPWYYFPLYRQFEAELAKSPYPLRPLADLIVQTNESFDKHAHLTDVFSYVETNDVDLEEGRIASSTQITGGTAPSRASYVVREGNFLIPNSIHSIRGVAVVSKAEDGYICTNRFFVVNANLAEVRPRYLFHIMRQPAILCLLKRESTGEISQTIPWSAFYCVQIPCPDLSTQDDIVSKIEKVDERRRQLLHEIDTQEQQILSVAGKSIPTLTVTARKLARQGYDYIASIGNNSSP